MNLGLSRKAALVLAASKGLGRATALALAQEGARVMIASRDAAQLKQTALELSHQTGADVQFTTVDVTDPAQCSAAFAAATRAFGRVDILVNNAGGPPFGSFEQFTDEQWHNALQLNLMSAVRFNRLVLPAMKEARWGRIVNIVSFGTKSVLSGSVLSTAGRLGIIGMAKLLSDEVASFDITVNNVAAGFILTDRVKDLPMNLEDVAQSIPAKRIGKPEELTALIAFLASEQAAYITGATIPVDGGAIRSIL